jgi:hypothetical protein
MQCQSARLTDQQELEIVMAETQLRANAKGLSQRLGVEFHEAVFLLEAAGGDVRVAAQLQSQLSATGKMAPQFFPAGPSPPTEQPSPPGGADWPTFKQAAAAQQDDWDLIEGAEEPESTQAEDDWVEIGDAGVVAAQPKSFKDAFDTRPGTPGMPIAGASTAKSRAARREKPATSVSDVRDETTGTAQFAFDEDYPDYRLSQASRSRDGHSKNSKKGSRQESKARRAAKAKRAGKTEW